MLELVVDVRAMVGNGREVTGLAGEDDEVVSWCQVANGWRGGGEEASGRRGCGLVREVTGLLCLAGGGSGGSKWGVDRVAGEDDRR